MSCFDPVNPPQASQRATMLAAPPAPCKPATGERPGFPPGTFADTDGPAHPTPTRSPDVPLTDRGENGARNPQGAVRPSSRPVAPHLNEASGGPAIPSSRAGVQGPSGGRIGNGMRVLVRPGRNGPPSADPGIGRTPNPAIRRVHGLRDVA